MSVLSNAVIQSERKRCHPQRKPHQEELHIRFFLSFNLLSHPEDYCEIILLLTRDFTLSCPNISYILLPQTQNEGCNLGSSNETRVRYRLNYVGPTECRFALNQSVPNFAT